MIQRYEHLLIGDLTDEREMIEDENGSWVRYEDYEAEKSAMCEANACPLLYEVKGRTE